MGNLEHHRELFPNAITVIPVEETNENRQLVTNITGEIKSDWSNAIMRGNPVYIVDGEHIAGYTPAVTALGALKTDTNDGLIKKLTLFPIPPGHPWHNPINGKNTTP